MLEAYKILAKNLNISHKQAKKYIDMGLVSLQGKRLTLARQKFPLGTHFHIKECFKTDVLYQDQELLVLNKATHIDSYTLEKQHKPYKLLHRLDKSTSGLLLLAQATFYTKALLAFKKREVYKEYLALIEGILKEPKTLTQPLSVRTNHIHFNKGFVKTFVDLKGKPAITHLYPIYHTKQQTLLKVVIETGITHQIRAHLSHIGHPIVGDVIYKGLPNPHFFLHAYKLALLERHFSAPIPPHFKEFNELLE
ncbi:RluA family pseudouridine synthase [Helicobacter suis]|uniref:RluA family pseudouridine synthase n=1 Tax=Helicobacter suis TaxID=104628 RepID=UPI0013D450A7|nr:RluA family pseudouridine synthase [Helicobacter suis]